jgi:hypothetical protein
VIIIDVGWIVSMSRCHSYRPFALEQMPDDAAAEKASPAEYGHLAGKNAPPTRARAFPTLDRVSISLRDVVAALNGSLIILTMLWLWRHSKGSM